MTSKKEQLKEKLAELAEVGKQIAKFAALVPLSRSEARVLSSLEAKELEELHQRRIQLEKEVREPMK